MNTGRYKKGMVRGALCALLVALALSFTAPTHINAAGAQFLALGNAPSPGISRVVVRAVITWNGAGGDGRWSNPANWEGGVMPGPFDVARFTAASGNALIDADFASSVAGIVLEKGYAGTLANAAAVEALTAVLIAINIKYKVKGGVRITGL